MSNFNLFAAHNTWRPGGFRTRVQMPMGRNVSITNNVTIKNGPSGFWGFMGGLFSGLGMGICMPSFNTSINSGVYGMLNGMQQQGHKGELSLDQKKNNLSELFKDFGYTSVINNGDGTFTLHGGGKDVKTLPYDEAIKYAESLGAKDQGTSTSSTGTTTSTPSSQTTQTTGSTQTTQTTGSAQTSQETGSTQTTQTTGSAQTSQETEGTGATSSTSTSTGQTSGARGTARAQGAAASGSKSPKGWYRANNSNEGSIGGLLTPGTTAAEVLNKILQGKMDYLSNADRELLAKELERKNPSIFEGGKVKAGADIGKFDIPSIKYIQDNYVGNTTTTSNGRVQYDRKKADEAKSKEHGSPNTHSNSTIKGTNGYYATKGSDGWHYYDPSGTAISGAEFKKYCPTIYNTTIQGHVQVKSPGTVGQSNGYMGSHLRR